MAKVVFFYGWTLPAILTRLRTWRWGQKWGDVPSHVCILAGKNAGYYEAIVSGVRSGPVGNACSGRQISVDVPDGAALTAYLQRQIGDAYDWVAIFEDTIGSKLPKDLLLSRHRRRSLICSTYVLDALLVGGVKIHPDQLPETPNDLYLALTALKSQS